MEKIRNLTAFASLIFILLIHAFAQGATSFTKVVMTTGSISEREGAIYVAQDLGFFRKYGLDVSFIQVRSGPIGMAALSSGESHLHWGSVSAANLGAIAEGADLVFIAGFVNRLTGMFVANPKITRPEELKGKRIGVNSLSGGGWIFTVLTLDYWGSCPNGLKFSSDPWAINRSSPRGFLATRVAGWSVMESGIPGLGFTSSRLLIFEGPGSASKNIWNHWNVWNDWNY